MSTLRGTPVSPGIAIGKAIVVQPMGLDVGEGSISRSDVEQETGRFHSALTVAACELENLERELSTRVGEDHAAIIRAQRLMLQDPSLTQAVEEKIRTQLLPAHRACLESGEEQATVLEAMEDEYLAARAEDVRDATRRAAKILMGVDKKSLFARLHSDAVIIAVDLAPSDTASLDATKVAAIVLDRGGRTSHTSILARSLGIPAVVATGDATTVVKEGSLVAVDGDSGQVILEPDGAELAELKARAVAFAREKRQLSVLRDLPAVTSDGHRLELSANLASLAEARAALEAGADGVGLFRTEFLFIDRTTMPTEEEQFEAYGRVLADMRPRPVVIRTLDIGGDKKTPYLGQPDEENPFLGLRAIRLCLQRRDVFQTQLRALLRASVFGNLRIMFPMIADVQELREAKAEVARAREGLAGERIAVSDSIQVGIMVEIPSAAVGADILAPECDFFSIGTNDLVQYTLACDRGNPAVAYLSDPFAPAVLRLVKRTIDEGHKQGIWVGMCGEMAGLAPAIPLLVGMGIDELSMSPSVVPQAKRIIRGSEARKTSLLWDEVKTMTRAEDIRKHLESALQ